MCICMCSAARQELRSGAALPPHDNELEMVRIGGAAQGPVAQLRAAPQRSAAEQGAPSSDARASC